MADASGTELKTTPDGILNPTKNTLNIESPNTTPVKDIAPPIEPVGFAENLARRREENGLTDMYEKRSSVFLLNPDFTPRASRKDLQNPELEDAFTRINYPTFAPKDEGDPEENQIYQLLGDVTIPRSFLPAIEVLAHQRFEAEKKEMELYLKDRPYKIAAFEEAGTDWIGKSSEVDKAYLADQRSLLLNLLYGTREMTTLRAEAWNLFNRYTNSKVSKSSTAESYFTAESLKLWDKMSTFAKNYLRYGVDRNLRVDLKEGSLDNSVEKVFELSKSLSKTGETGTVYIDDGKPDEFYNWNSIDFRFEEDRIVGVKIDEATRNRQHSPLLSLIRANLDSQDVQNNNADGKQIGPFKINLIYHAYAFREHQITIDLNTYGWSEERIHDFITGYIRVLKAEPKSEGDTVITQLRSLGIKDAI